MLRQSTTRAKRCGLTCWTDAFTTVDASLGVMLLQGTAEASIRATNLFNTDALQHIFGDIIGRRVVAEFALTVQ